MSTTIDQRVVEMKFDNKHFESNASTTIKTLDKLKQSLKLDGASKGLEQLSDATAKTTKTLDEFEYAAYESGFTWRDVLRKISSTAEWRIAQQAVDMMTNALKKLGNALLGIEPMKAGFQEYETQMNAVQTILANTESKGTTLDDVNSALDELNKYADKTIYNFTEMTRNIGTFTAAGTDLETSVKAIQGIANLAAVSGSTSQQASTAMYQLSQAMASGTVKLMDWNSVVNAGMGGQVFQDALKETARVHGVAIDDIISKNGSFRESLSEGWLTTEILTDTLEKFTMYAEEGSKEWEEYKKTLMSKGYTEKQAEEILKMGKTATEAATKVKTFTQLFDTLKEAAQSGWTQTWEILVGDFEEAKELLTAISDVVGGFINNMSESRNELLENWKVMGGRQDLIDSFKNIFEALLSVIKPIKDAFTEIFPPATAEQLVKITRTFKEFTEKLKLSDEGADNLKRTFKGVFAVFKAALTILKAVFKAVGAIIGGFSKLGGSLFGVTAVLGDCLSFFSEMITSGNLIEKVFVGIGKVIKFVIEVISWLIKGATSFFELIAQGVVFPGITVLVEGLRKVFESFTGVGDSATSFKDKVTGAFSSVGNALKNNVLFKVLTKLWDVIKVIGSTIGKVFGNIGGQLIDILKNADIMRMLEIVNSIIAGGVGIGLIKFLKSLGGVFDSFADVGIGLGESIDNLLGTITGSFKAFQNNLNAEAIKNLAISIAILAAAILVLSLIDSDKLTDAVAAITLLFAGLMGSMAVLGKAGAGGFNMAVVSTTLIGLGIAVLVLASALKKISSLSLGQLTTGLMGVLGLMAILVTSLKVLAKDSTSIKAGVAQMITVAYAIKIMAGVLLDISNLNWEELWIGVIGMVVSMGTIVGAMKLLPLGTGDKIAKPFYKFIAQMTAVASACKIMASVLTDLAYLEWNELGVGLVGMITTMGVLVAAMKILATIGDSTYVKGEEIFSSSTSFAQIAIALVGLATAVRILVPAIEILGKMEWGELGKAGVVFAALLGVIEVFSLELKYIESGDFLKTATGLLIMSASLVVLASALKKFAKLEWEELGKGGAVLGGVVAALALLSTISLYVKPGKLNAMAASLAIVAASMNMLVVPLIAFSRLSWESLGKAGAVLGGLIVALAALGGLSLLVNPGLLNASAAALAVLAASLGLMVPPLIAFGLISWGSIGKGLAIMAGSLLILTGVAWALKALKLDLMLLKISGAVALLGAGIYLVGAGLVLAGAGLASFGAGLAVLATSVGSVAVVLIKLLPSLIESLVLGLGAALGAICNVVIDNAPLITGAIVSIIGMACAAITESVPQIVHTILVLLDKTLSEIAEYAPSLADSLFKITVSLLESFSKFVPSLVDMLVDIVIKIVDGVAEKAPELVTSLVNLFSEIFKALGSALSGFDTGDLLKGVVAVAILAKLVDSLAKIKMKSIPKAMLGLAGVGALMIELGAILVIIGGLSRIPEVGQLISDGGDLLGKLSNAVIKSVPLIAAVAVLMAVSSGLSALIGPAIAGLAGIAVIIAELAALIAVFGLIAQDSKFVWLLDTGGELLVKLAGIIGRVIGAFVGGFYGGVIEGVSAGLVVLGAALRLFFEEVKDIDSGAFKEVSLAALYLSIAVLAMTGSAALGQILKVGKTAIQTYGMSVVALGAALAAFSVEVALVDAERVKTASIAAVYLSAAVLAFTGTTALTQLLKIGKNGITTYAASVVALGAALAAFSLEASLVDAERVKTASVAAVYLSAAVLAMTAASFLTGLMKVNSTGLVNYGAAVLVLGTALAVFNLEVKDVKPEVIKAASIAAVYLSAAVLIMTGAGFLAGLVSVTGLVGYVAAVLGLGIALAAFNWEVKDVKPEVIQAASIAANYLSLAVAIMTGAGFLAGLVGIIALPGFVMAVAAIGSGLSSFYEEVKDVKPAVVKAAADAAGPLNTAVLAMTGAGLLAGISALLTGGISVVSYMASVVAIGSSIKGFYDAVTKDGGITESKVTAAANAAEPLTRAVLLMTDAGFTNALANVFTLGGTNASYKKAVEVIGEAIAGFSDKVKDISVSKVEAAAIAADKVSEAINVLPKDTKHLISFGDNLTDLGTNIALYYTTLANVSKDSIESSSNAISSIKDIGAIDTSKIKAVSDSISELVKSLKELGAKSVKAFVDEFKDLGSDLKKIAKKALDSFIGGVDEKKSKVTNAFAKIAEEAAEAVDDKKNSFKKVGKNIVQGLADGISENSFIAEAKAKAMAEAALEAARKALDVNSPSKVFRALGYSIPEGLAAGINKLSGMAENSAADMADGSINRVKDAMSRISDSLSKDVDAQPTISPVIDLSNVKAGANSINKMLSFNSTMGVMANVSAVNSMMRQRNQNGANDDVVSAIDKLSKHIGDTRGDTYNFGNISYDDGTSISDAVQSLVRAVLVDKRR